MKYLTPVNFSMPDSVTYVNTTMVDFNIPTISTHTEHSFNGDIIARLIGFIRLPENWYINEKLWICSSFAEAELFIQSHAVEPVVSVKPDEPKCKEFPLPSPESSILYVDLQAKRPMDKQTNNSKIGLQHNRTKEDLKPFTFEYLEPFSNGTCHQYSNCLHCLSDTACAWCDVSNSCMSRDLNEEENCRDTESWHYFTISPTECKNCSNFVRCSDCVANGHEWWSEDARCNRRGRSDKAVKTVEACPLDCDLRDDCSSCLAQPGRCVW